MKPDHNNHIFRRAPLFTIILALILLTACGAGQPDSASTRIFKIGEISNIPGGGVTNPAAATSTVASTPTPAPTLAVPALPRTTNGKVGSRQLSFRDSLAKLGYIDGKNLTYIFDPDSITSDKLDAAAQSLVAAKVDVIVAYGTAAALAAQRAVSGTNIPVVFVGSVDPVQLGLVKSLQNTEGNITGVGGVSDAYAKQLEWLIRIVPGIHTVYLPYPNLTNPVTAAPLKAIQGYADKSGINLITAELPTQDDVTAAIANMPDVDAIMLVPFSSLDFVQVSLDKKIPLAYSFPNIMDIGPFLSYNYTEEAVGSAAAGDVDRILKGAKPSDIPVEIAANSLAINLKTAGTLGITVPDDILQQADIIVR